jgi:predicted ATP-dependent endonuclease of OLD family
MERLLQRLSVLVGERGGSAYRGEVHEQGLGGANLIYLALKLLEDELKLSSDRVAHFFLIEEPEAHIHTHIQRTLFSNLPSQRTQVIVSTHSTHVSSASRVASVNVLAKVDDYAEVYQPANGLSPEQRSRLERYVDAVRSTLLFAKGVLLVEGDAEQLLIPAMLRCVFGVSPDELGFSVISMSCSFFEHVATVFGEARIKRPCAIVTDLDRALCSLPENSDADSKEQARARASQAAGEQRRRSLTDFQDGNRWVRAFSAEYTFEVDFIRAGNSPETVRTLDSIYTVEGSKQKSTERLKSADVQVSGTEILRLAEKCGKGWFALLLSEKLDSRTLIPDYILRAVAFACSQSISDLVLKRIVEFRLQTEAASDFVAAMPTEAELTALTPAEVVARYRTAAETDLLSRFCQYVAEFRQA